MHDLRTSILLALWASGGSVPSRTFLQKLIYLAGAKAGLTLPYGPDLYGPYSPEVAAEVDRLVEAGILSETVERFPSEPGGFERRRHTYELTEEGRVLANEHLAREDFPGATFAKEAEAIWRMDCDYRQLSLAAKVHWVLSDTNAPATFEQARQQAEWRNWHLTAEDVERAVDLLVDLGLAERSTD